MLYKLIAWQALVVSVILSLWTMAFFPGVIAAKFSWDLPFIGSFFLLCGWVIISAIIGFFAPVSWWGYTGLCAALLFLFLIETVILHYTFQHSLMAKSEAFAAHFGSVLLFVAVHPLAGFARIAVQLIKRIFS